MKLNTLRDNKGARHRAKLLGRGIGSGKGKTSGKGHKGQKARAGCKIQRGFEGGQTPLHMRLPKRGFNCPSREEMRVMNISDINSFVERKKIKEDEVINAELLTKLGIIKKGEKIKLLGVGELHCKVKVKFDKYSKSALAKLEKFGKDVVVN